MSKQEFTTLGRILRQLPSSAQIRPTEALYLLLGRHDWMPVAQAWNLIATSRNMDLDWDAYWVSVDQATEPTGIYLFGPGGEAHRAFELLQ